MPGQLRILIAEDNADHLELLRRALTAQVDPEQIDVVTNGGAFAKAIRTKSYDCIVLDFNLALDQAPDLLADHADVIGETPVVVVSASTDQEVVIRSFKVGVTDFIPKQQAIVEPLLWGRMTDAMDTAVRRREERRRHQRRLETLERAATTDPLTGLRNRRFVDAHLADERTRSDRRSPTGVAVIDIDRFKRINDTLGHDAGDAVLREIAWAIERAAGAQDIVARWGGEEFVVFRQSADLASMWAWADDARRAIERRKVHAAGVDISVTVSIGVVSVPVTELSPESVSRADRALYFAKANGRNRVATWQMACAFDAASSVARGGLCDESRYKGLIDSAEHAGILGPEQREHTGPHSLAVARLAESIGRAAGLDDHDLAALRRAARFHDIGKLGIPDELLAKPSPLTEPERRMIDEHARLGAEIAAALGFGERVCDAIAGHHRWFDAAKGRDHTLGPARPRANDNDDDRLAPVIAVADAVVTMLSDRPYQPRRENPEIAEELRKGCGDQFDPALVNVMATPEALDAAKSVVSAPQAAGAERRAA